MSRENGWKDMPDYRVYSIYQGRISDPPEVVTCDNDEQAIERASKLKGRCPVELWQGERLVAKID